MRLSWQVVVGLALIPVVILKLLSTGWRFARYYTRSPDYVALFVVATNGTRTYFSGTVIGPGRRR